MKQLLIVLLILGYFSSSAQAQDPDNPDKGYFGVFYGVLDSGDDGIENKNLGIVLGGNLKSGPGVEFFYTNTVDKDEIKTTGAPDIRYETQAWGLMGTYRVGTKVYAKFKAGYTFVDLKGEFSGPGRQNFEEEGWAYGLGVGADVGNNGAIELNYLVLPDIEVSGGNEFFDIENELLSLGYHWYF